MKKTVNNSVSIKLSWATILTVLFVTLKLTGSISWPWIWVLSPIWISLLIWLFVFLFVLAILAVVLLKD